MIRVSIVEIDRDYNCYVGSEIMEFRNLVEAEQYCRDSKWSGNSYYVDYVLEPK